MHSNSAEIANCFNPCINKLIEGLDKQLSLGEPVDVSHDFFIFCCRTSLC